MKKTTIFGEHTYKHSDSEPIRDDNMLPNGSYITNFLHDNPIQKDKRIYESTLASADVDINGELENIVNSDMSNTATLIQNLYRQRRINYAKLNCWTT